MDPALQPLVDIIAPVAVLGLRFDNRLIIGNDLNNTILGSNGSDDIRAGGGNDVVDARDGDDWVFGQGGMISSSVVTTFCSITSMVEAAMTCCWPLPSPKIFFSVTMETTF